MFGDEEPKRCAGSPRWEGQGERVSHTSASKSFWSLQGPLTASLPLTFIFFLRWLFFPRIGMFARWHRRRASDNSWLTAQELSSRKGMLVLFCQHRHISPGKDLGLTLLPRTHPCNRWFRSCDQPDLAPALLSVAGVGERKEMGLQGTRIEESCRTLWNVGGVVQRS